MAQSFYGPDFHPVTQPTNSVKALKETIITDPSQWPGCILSSFATVILMEGPYCLLVGSPMPVPERRYYIILGIMLYSVNSFSGFLCASVWQASSLGQRWVLIRWLHVRRWWRSSVRALTRRLEELTPAFASIQNSIHLRNWNAWRAEWQSSWRNVDSSVMFGISVPNFSVGIAGDVVIFVLTDLYVNFFNTCD